MKRRLSRHRVAADISLYLYVGRGFIQDVIEDYLESFGKGYSKELVEKIENEVLQHTDILESLLLEEWADAAVVEWDNSSQVHGQVEYEGVESELDPEEARGLERVVEDFILPFVEEAGDQVTLDDLIWIPTPDSSNVAAFAYDYINRYMYVKFSDKGRGESIYRYLEVEPETYDQFFAAPSKGHAVWVLLRDRYQYERLQ